MNILNGIQNFLQILNDNWVTILVIIALLISIVKKTVDFMQKTDEEKIAIAKKQIQETMLRFITEAEIDYGDFIKAGSVKRSQVIEEIYLTYPILSKVADQDELVEWIDSVIDESLKIMRKIFEEQKEQTEE